MKHRSCLAVAAIVWAFAGYSIAFGQFFTGLGTGSNAVALSADGSTIVGTFASVQTGYFPFRWTQSGGLENIKQPSLWQMYPNAISGDGSVVVGDLLDHGAFRLDAEGLHDLGYHVGAYAVSGDGSIVAGAQPGPMSGLQSAEAYIANVAGDPTWLGFPANATFPYQSDVFALSFSGEVAAAFFNSMPGTPSVFRWTAASGAVAIGSIDFDGRSMSGDGNTIVGDDIKGAARWSMNHGQQSLGTLPGVENCAGLSASFDASTIVGDCWNHDDTGHESFISDTAHGMRNTQTVLADAGINLTGWQLGYLTLVSSDGLSFAGNGLHDGSWEAWYARLPEPSSLSMLGLVFLSTRVTARAASRMKAT